MLDVLFRSHISSDVSLRLVPGRTNSRYHHIMRFAIRHAESVLLPEDSELLLAREQIEQAASGMREYRSGALAVVGDFGRSSSTG